MGSEIDEIVLGIDRIASVDDEPELKRLQTQMDAFFLHPDAGENLQVWFRLFERFPEDDGFGVFWSILHGIERFPASDELVVASVQRKPSTFPVMMVNRMINGGIQTVRGINLLTLLETVARDEGYLSGVRADAEGFLAYQRAKV